jgi:hypothetical protein
MSIWKLTPIPIGDPLWLARSHRAPVIVGASDEVGARGAAQEQFGIAARIPVGAPIVGAPWTRPDLVRAEIFEESRHASVPWCAGSDLPAKYQERWSADAFAALSLGSVAQPF